MAFTNDMTKYFWCFAGRNKIANPKTDDGNKLHNHNYDTAVQHYAQHSETQDSTFGHDQQIDRIGVDYEYYYDDVSPKDVDNENHEDDSETASDHHGMAYYDYEDDDLSASSTSKEDPEGDPDYELYYYYYYDYVDPEDLQSATKVIEKLPTPSYQTSDSSSRSSEAHS